MIREKKHIAYSFEHGDKSLPHLKDLVSDVPDAEKNNPICMSVRLTVCIDQAPRYICRQIP